MKTIAFLVAVGVCIGCGGGSVGMPVDPLASTAWVSPIAGFQCEKGFEFDADGGYTFAIGCVLTDGNEGGYVEQGTYSASEHVFTTIARSASCPADQVQQVFSANFLLTNTTLTLSVPSGATVYSRFTPTAPMAGTIIAGCFDTSGNFNPLPVMPL